MEVEFFESPRPEGSVDLAPDAPPPRYSRARPLRRQLLVAAVSLVSVGAVTVAVLTPNSSTPSSPDRISSVQEKLSLIALTAGNTSIEDDVVVVTGLGDPSCPAVKPGFAPQDRALDAVRAVLPGYRLMDFSRTLDLAAHLCAIQVRARDSAGVVIVLQSEPPSGGTRHGADRVDEKLGQPGTLVTEYAMFTDSTGWSVIAGASGVAGDLPGTAVLARLASDSRLRW